MSSQVSIRLLLVFSLPIAFFPYVSAFAQDSKAGTGNRFSISPLANDFAKAACEADAASRQLELEELLYGMELKLESIKKDYPDVFSAKATRVANSILLDPIVQELVRALGNLRRGVRSHDGLSKVAAMTALKSRIETVVGGWPYAVRFEIEDQQGDLRIKFPDTSMEELGLASGTTEFTLDLSRKEFQLTRTIPGGQELAYTKDKEAKLKDKNLVYTYTESNGEITGLASQSSGKVRVPEEALGIMTLIGLKRRIQDLDSGIQTRANDYFYCESTLEHSDAFESHHRAIHNRRKQRHLPPIVSDNCNWVHGCPTDTNSGQR